MTDTELLEQSVTRQKELSSGIETMRRILATKELLAEDDHSVRILIAVGDAQADMTSAFQQEALERFVNLELDSRLEVARAKLETFNISVPKRLTEAKEKTEDAVGQNDSIIAKADKVIEETKAVIKQSSDAIEKKDTPEPRSGKDVISDKELHHQYFKLGKKIKQIAEETGLGQAGLYKRIEKMQQEMKRAEKERARQ